MKLPKIDQHLIAQITSDYLSGVPFAEISFTYGIPVARLQSMFIQKPTKTFTDNLSYGLKLLEKAERILFQTAENYHLFPPETKKALDSLLFFYSKADLNNHRWVNLEIIINKFKSDGI